MNPQFPVYIISCTRWESRHTSRALEKLGVPYHIVVEADEYDEYAKVIDPAKVLILDPQYQRDFDYCDEFGLSKRAGPAPARNFCWDHAINRGYAWHWVMDDNIQSFYRLNRNKRMYMADGTGFRVMEDFCLRYENIAMAGPHYDMFAPERAKKPPFIWNTRVFSCQLIRNDVPFRWRARYNDDVDLSLRMLKAGWCTVQFLAFLQKKIATMRVKGGNTDELYLKDGTLVKSQMLYDLHPDVTRITWRFGRAHHYVDYRRFQQNIPRLKPGLDLPDGTNEYGMQLLPASR